MYPAKHPEVYQHYAAMLDTAINADRIGKYIVSHRTASWPKTSEHVVVGPHTTTDGWGHPFCIVPMTSRVVVISGGASGQGRCDPLPVSKEEIVKSQKRVYADPSGAIVVIVLPSAPEGEKQLH